ncbi:MAG: hypothetical protein EXS10_06060 [Phycisphaerales bacterium]|nr:hypothetical protein [Phycisphaerales bacterium]
MKTRTHRSLLVTLALITVAPIGCSTTMGGRMGESVTTLESFRASKSIPPEVLEGAKAVAVLRRSDGSFIIGGGAAQGVFLVRNRTGWSSPVSIESWSVSLGLQAGGTSTEIVMVFNSADEITSFLQSGTYMMGGAAAAFGKSNASASSSGGPVPTVAVFAKVDGVYVGASLDGTSFRVDEKQNAQIYGSTTTTQDIIDGKVPPPAGATVLWQALEG